jgi:ATP adenylyltransferase
MDLLFTPWRLDYVKGERTHDGCVFCDCQTGEDEAECILHRSRHWFVILNRYPYNSGHLLLVSRRHVGSLTELEPEAIADMARLTAAMERTLRRVYKPHGINGGYNAGGAAGAGIPGHFHLHVLPRWTADTNFMTVIGDARVMPETLPQSYAGIRPVLADELAGTGL